MIRTDEEFKSLVEHVFAKDGWLVSKGYAHRKEQSAYARDVASWLLNKDQKVGLIEAGTGIGKTVGYLIPMMIFQAWKDKPVIVSTYTIALQAQILDSDIDIAYDFLEEHGIRLPKVARRFGLRQFICPERVAKREEYLRVLGDISEDWLRFKKWFEFNLEQGYATFEEWANYCSLELPCGLEKNDICVLTNSGTHPGIKRMLLEVDNADLILTSHTGLLINVRMGGRFFQESCFKETGDGNVKVENESREFLAVLLDEADKAISAAESIYNRKLQLNEIRRYLKSIKKSSTVLKQALELIGVMDSTLGKLDNHYSEANIIDSEKDADTHRFVVESVGQLGKWLFHLSQNKYHEKDIDAAELQEIANYLAEFETDIKSDKPMAIRSIGFSKENRFVSLMTYVPGASAFYNYYAKRGISTLYTSGTLSDGYDKDYSFGHFRSEVRIDKKKLAVEKSYFPKKYGVVDFKLPPRDVSPIFNEDGDYYPSWLQFASNQISLAAANGKNVLVLVPSFREVEKLVEYLPNMMNRIISHQRGDSIPDVISRFKDVGGVLLTPSMWEGVSIRNEDGSQFFDQLVITRIPSAPYTEAEKAVFIQSFMSFSKPSDYKKAKGYFYARNTIRAINRSIQGIGRLIRSAEDVGTIWFCDYKMPTPDSIPSHKAYFRIIPPRFRRKYLDACELEEALSLDKVA